MPTSDPAPRLVAFAGGATGAWRVDRIDAVIGETLPPAARLAISETAAGAAAALPDTDAWHLAGFTSNLRYTDRGEKRALVAASPPLQRDEARRAALIPIRKTAAWWALAQDERQAIFTAQSRHTAIGMDYLPGVARRLHHCRDLGGEFDFLTWFEFAEAETAAFDAMLVRLRATQEWRYIDREVDIRLTRSDD